ncbi:MAG: hypothetical protein HQL03_07115 [Nitrospirae bacterium]|nr:hypothetical protein [Nitrospirota bacterium]MBF0591082.1 hypothetical protein [Nitrospirota bacterium]
MSYVFYALALIVAGGIVGGAVSTFGKGSGRLTGLISLVSVAGGAVLMVKAAYAVLFLDYTHVVVLDLGPPLGVLPLEMDGLSALFVCIIGVMGSLTVLYMQGYMVWHLNGDTNKSLAVGRHYMFFNLMIASMVVVVTVRNTIAFLIAWEIMLLCVFFMLLFEHKSARTRTIARDYIAYMHVGVVVLMAGFASASVYCGGVDFKDLAALKFGASGGELPMSVVVYCLLLVGFASMAGVVPFHGWITKTSSSDICLLSGFLINMGIYGTLRVIAEAGTPPRYAGYVVLIFSVIAGVWGVLNSIVQGDLRRIVTYNSVENVGIIGIGVGTGLIGQGNGLPMMAALGFSGAMLHTLNHTLFKGLMSYSVGYFIRSIDTIRSLTTVEGSDIDLMGGLMKRMPTVGLLFLCACMSVLPPFNGFISVAVIFMGLLGVKASTNGVVLSAGGLGIAALALINGLTAIALIKTSGYVLLGQPRSSQAAEATQPPPSMLLPMVVLGVGCLMLGLLPELLIGVIRGALTSLHISDVSAIKETSLFVSSMSMACLLPMFTTAAVLLLRSLAPADQHIVLVHGAESQRPSVSFFVAGSAAMTSVTTYVASVGQEAGRVFPWLWQRSKRAIEAITCLQNTQQNRSLQLLGMRHYMLYLLATLLITLLLLSG